MKLNVPVRVILALALFLLVCCSLSPTACSSKEPHASGRSGIAIGTERVGIVEAAGPSTPQEDRAHMTAKVTSARQYFETTWAEFFRKRGVPYKSPAIVAYQRPISTPCGMQPPGNAFFCPPGNAIYYDEAFLTALMKRVAGETGGDGDYAPITVLAHEWGHAVEHWLEQAPGAFQQQYIFFREQEADCFAGSITKMAERSGYLDSGDLEEARHVLALGGDRPYHLSNPDNRDGFLSGHGTAEERIASFNRGYQKGVAFCDIALDPDWWRRSVEEWKKAWDNRTFKDMLRSPEDQPTLGPRLNRKPYTVKDPPK